MRFAFFVFFFRGTPSLKLPGRGMIPLHPHLQPHIHAVAVPGRGGDPSQGVGQRPTVLKEFEGKALKKSSPICIHFLSGGSSLIGYRRIPEQHACTDRLLAVQPQKFHHARRSRNDSLQKAAVQYPNAHGLRQQLHGSRRQMPVDGIICKYKHHGIRMAE